MILCSSRCRHQHYRENQSGSHPRPIMAKCKSEHMHIPHDSRPEGKRTKHSNTIHYCELQSSRTLTPPQGSHSGLHRERLQGRRSVRNLQHGTTGKRTTQKLDTRKKMTGKVQ